MTLAERQTILAGRGRFFFSGPAMSLLQADAASKPKFDNNGQYSRTSILRYEKIFGEHYISTGGAETTDNLCRRLGNSLRPGARVLDVGSGIGGAAFHLANAYGARVTGIDLAEEMVAIALERAQELGLSERGHLHPGGRSRDPLRRTSSTSSGAATP